MGKYQHIFFDLDDTLWDFQKNSSLALSSLFEKYGIHEHNIKLEDFLRTFHTINERLWKQYSFGRIDKEYLRTKRFKMIFNELGYFDEQQIVNFGREYLTICPYNSHVIEGSFELLDYLKPKYALHVITNGFKEIAHIKLKSSGLGNYFSHVVTSEKAGAKKPSPVVFNYALEISGATLENALMIGNDPVADIEGARSVNIDQVFCNFSGAPIEFKPTFEVSSLREIINIL